MTHPSAAQTFDEIEQALAAETKEPAGAKGSEALQTKLDGDGIPEELRGKTVGELVEYAGNLKSAVLHSEEARKDILRRVESLEQKPAEKPMEPPPEVQFTEDDFKKMYEEDPAQAFVKMQEATERRILKNFESRFVPLVQGSVSQAEDAARTRWATEFEVLGDEIEGFIKTQLRGDRTILATPRAWDDMIAYIRGIPKNTEKLFEARTKKSVEADRKAAEARAVATTGFSGTDVSRRAPVVSSAGELDAVEREIADKLGMTHDEYSKWKKVGG